MKKVRYLHLSFRTFHDIARPIKPLLNKKLNNGLTARIYVTHQVQNLPIFDNCVFVKYFYKKWAIFIIGYLYHLLCSVHVTVPLIKIINKEPLYKN